jgi:hypothetical protein
MILLAISVTAFGVLLGVTFVAAMQDRRGEANKRAVPTISIVIGSAAIVAGVWLLVILV